MRSFVVVVLAACHGKTPQPPPAEPVVIAGAFPVDRGPDGNSIILAAPRGLIVVDTGRHTEHQDKILAYAKRTGKPIAAIVNTHWHLDHTGGNAELRAVYPDAEIIATNAVDGALGSFFQKNPTPPENATAPQLEDFKLGREAIADTKNLRPSRPITESGAVEIAGRMLDLHVTAFAATEADLWIYDAASKTVIAGDLVVDEVPFFDSGCPDGWQRALGEIAATPFERLIPGHGPAMTREQFTQWRAAFDAWIACAASDAETAKCVDTWTTAAAPFIPKGDEARIAEYATYYTAELLRSPEARERFCHPLAR
jgi:glyoxylase-like metal-dependent hydrolase (beta-lactamase superfamily II)